MITGFDSVVWDIDGDGHLCISEATIGLATAFGDLCSDDIERLTETFFGKIGTAFSLGKWLIGYGTLVKP